MYAHDNKLSGVLNMVYSGRKLKEISFPLGGIGTGSIGLSGNGSLIDIEIFNRPNKGSSAGYTFFAIRAEYPDGKSITKVLKGDHNKELSGKHCYAIGFGLGHGVRENMMSGFPHFKKVKFDGKFPIATLTFEDDDFPARVILNAFNPFIPLDADNSSIPAAFFDIKVESFLDNIKYTLVFSAENPFQSTQNIKVENDKFTALKLINSGVSEDDLSYGDITIATDCKDGLVQEYWYRETHSMIWHSKIITFWDELTKGNLTERHYDNPAAYDIGVITTKAVINKNESKDFHFVLSWNVPNCYNYWNPLKDENGKDVTWKNYYTKLFANSTETAFYSLNNWDMLYSKTKNFCKSLHSSTLDKSVIDAISSNISVLKTPTVLRLEDGTFYGWEGVHEQAGSCEGTCTHVWSYAYALCFLFPELERSIRNAEFKYDIDKFGGMDFRTKLPLGREKDPINFPCVDGQMATVTKIYRDWKITGNDEWLRDNWDNIKKILEFAWNEGNSFEWDKDKDGVLEGRQHHTLDVELFGPSSWLEGMYLSALKSASEMADYLGDYEKRDEYLKLFNNGYEWTKQNLYNGKYFIHKIDVKNREYVEHFNCPYYWNDEVNEISFQISEGSAIDQMLGQWHANICGLGDIFDKEQRKNALKNMFKNNYKPKLRDVANPWRVFALNDEGGAMICTYPEGSLKPSIPITYGGECMTGFEYAFAGLLISEGFIDEGLQIVKAIRDRYDGEKRNPWNEIECGSNYARTMASFALLPIFSGFKFNLPKNEIGFAPLIEGNFKCFWSLGTGWGDFVKTKKQYKILISSGVLTLQKITIGDLKTVKKVLVDGKSINFSQDDNDITFECITASKEIKVIL